MTYTEILKPFREKYEGANTGGAISSLQMDAMIRDILQVVDDVRWEAYKKGYITAMDKVFRPITPKAFEDPDVCYDVLAEISMLPINPSKEEEVTSS